MQDNLDAACAAIEKAAMERAVNDVDDGFSTSYEVRRRHREVRFQMTHHRFCSKLSLSQLHSAQPFWDPSVPLSNFTAALPDPLRIKPSGVQAHQLVVYQDFGKFFYMYIYLNANTL